MSNYHRLVDLVNDPQVGDELCQRLNAWCVHNRPDQTARLTRHTLFAPDIWESRRTTRARLSKAPGKRNADLELTDPELYRDLMAAIDWARVKSQGLLTDTGTITMTTTKERQKEAVRATRKRLNARLHDERKKLGFTSMPSKEERAQLLQPPAKVSVQASVVHRKPMILGNGIRLLLVISSGSQAAVAGQLGMSQSGINNVLRGYVIWSWEQYQPLVAAVAKVLNLSNQEVFDKALALGVLSFAEASNVTVEVTDVPFDQNAADAAPAGTAGDSPA